ncbi:uncharacterized protein [Mytilus edulis]|uniref:uncharacterized protein n=1 Tax=Mytilus edulis TaxID=6550 RepID=UPI0039EEEB72
MENDDLDEKLRNVYYNTANGGAYLSAEKIYQTLKTSRDGNVPSVYKIRKWMEKIDDYNLQKPVKRRIKRVKIIVSEPYEQYDADLMDVSNIQKYNNKTRFLLVVIDIFTRFLWIYPLKNKFGKTVADAFEKIFKHGKIPLKVSTDAGTEFKNKNLKRVFKKYDIYHHVYLNSDSSKASIAERVNLTFRRMMFRYFTKHRTYSYLNVIQNLVASYNATPHRSLNNTAPKDVNEKNKYDLWAYMYIKTPPKEKRIREKKETLKVQRKRGKQFHFKINDMVRLSHLKKPFQRAYQQQWTSEIFKIYRRFLIHGKIFYKVQDFLDKEVVGNFNYTELQRVKKEADALWFVEKVLKWRRRNGQREGYVKFQDWDKRFCQWIPERDIVDF